MAGYMERLVDKWENNSVVTSEQAQIMRADIVEDKKERTSSKLISILSTLGALSLGIGAFLFIASNWTSMSSVFKVILLTVCTAISTYAGYSLTYERANFPRVGHSLLFLGSLLFGGSIFLIAQIYHVNANNHSLVLLWMIGILPLVYGLRNRAVASLFGVLSYLWIGLFVFRGFNFSVASKNFVAFPVLYLVFAVLMFALGSLPFHLNKFDRVSRIFRLMSVKVILGSLFLLSFELFSGHVSSYTNIVKLFAKVTPQFTFAFIGIAVLAALACAYNIWIGKPQGRFRQLEQQIGLTLCVIGSIFFLFPVESGMYTLIFNLILLALILTVLLVGHHREDMSLINIGMMYVGLFILVRYFDFFWELLPRSIFFLVGGCILVVGGIFFEKKRNALRQEFQTRTSGGDDHE